jgi:hypothetical protein
VPAPSEAKETSDGTLATAVAQPAVPEIKPIDKAPKPAPSSEGLGRVTTASVSATSSMRGGSQSYAAWRAFDEVAGAPEGFVSGWCEGVKGPGAGEVLTVTFAEPTDLGQIFIAAASPGVNLDFLAIDDASKVEIRLDGKGDPLASAVDAKGNITADTAGQLVTSLTFTVANSDPYEDTCILDIRFSKRSVMVVTKLKTTLPTGLRETLQSATTAMAKCDASGLEGLHYPFETVVSDSSDGVGVTSMAEQVSLNGAASRKHKNAKALVSTCREMIAGEEDDESEDMDWQLAKTLTPYPGRSPNRILVYAGTTSPDGLDAWLLWDCELLKGKWRVRGAHFYGDRDEHLPH